ncbi:MAG: hypothetical protein AB7F22_02860 [Reyranella sp.]|uniref:hypothetical protein n=1 Tax=Reyranella sp. TaxID=1929291 RepID=UPI003D0BC20B
MIVDHRTYELQPGRLREFLTLYEKQRLPVHTKHLGNLVHMNNKILVPTSFSPTK